MTGRSIQIARNGITVCPVELDGTHGVRIRVNEQDVTVSAGDALDIGQSIMTIAKVCASLDKIALQRRLRERAQQDPANVVPIRKNEEKR